MGVLIAGTHSGCGKTTVSIGIMAALSARGIVLAPFKAGPDYIDPGFHAYVTGQKSHNLDAYMLNTANLKYLYAKYAQGKCAMIEGVMGMFDGYGKDGVASSAHVSRITGTPVVLVIDGKGMSTSAAAIVKGFADFDPSVTIAGVIVNRVSNDAHYRMIKAAVETHTGIPCLGYLPKDERIALYSRHLGLIPQGEVAGLDEKIQQLRHLVEAHIDLDAIVKIAQAHDIGPVTMPDALCRFYEDNRKRFADKRIGIARDAAFTFYYEANLDMLRELGARLVPFSPLADRALPEGLEALYMGGGFPEVFAEQLSDNALFRQNLTSRFENGLRCYAECGGFMYLARSITTLEKETYDMVGLFNTGCMMTKRLKRFGYVTVDYNGLRFGAHEFHHSYMEEGDLDYRYRIEKHRDGMLIKTWKCGAQHKNTIAGYPHVHFYAEPHFVTKVLSDG